MAGSRTRSGRFRAAYLRTGGTASTAVAAAMVALVLFCWYWRAFRSVSTNQGLVDYLSISATCLAASGTAWAASRRCPGSPGLRSCWHLIALASVANLGMSLFQTVSELAGSRPDSTIADLLGLPFYPLIVRGLMFLPRAPRTPAQRLRLLLDVAVVAVGGSAVALYALLGIVDQGWGSGTLRSVILIPDLLGDVILLLCVSRLSLGSPPRSTYLAMRALAVALMVYVASNLAHCYGILHSGHPATAAIDGLSIVAIALLAFAGAAQRRVNTQEDLSPAAQEPHLRGLPFCAVAIAFGALFFVQRNDTVPQLAPAFAVMLLVTLVTARQLLTQRDLLSTQRQLSHLSLHDALTGLPNRVLVADRADAFLARARRHQVPAAALYVDLDGFKNVNDRFGHAAGDELLKEVAARLSSVARETDTVGRMGGDEFVLLLEEASMVTGPQLVAERVLDVLRRPVALGTGGDRLVSITPSIGIAIGEQCSAEELFRDADFALYEAKRAGRDRAVLFESKMRDTVKDRFELGLDLTDALDREEFLLLYQPTLDLRTGALIGTEALIRWRHPVRGIVAPDQFIPLAEDSGLIVALGRWVLETACRQGAEWRRGGHDVSMYVNISTRQLERDELVENVGGALEGTGLDPAALVLEVTETGLMHDADSVALRLQALKRLGVRVAIDDFGTGYSSLAYLARFPADVLKIDRSFISGMAASEGSGAAMIHLFIQLGKSLGLETLGEGIETHAQLEGLQSEQCDLGQGFLFARPLEARAITERLGERRSWGEYPEAPTASESSTRREHVAIQRAYARGITP